MLNESCFQACQYIAREMSITSFQIKVKFRAFYECKMKPADSFLPPSPSHMSNLFFLMEKKTYDREK